MLGSEHGVSCYWYDAAKFFEDFDGYADDSPEKLMSSENAGIEKGYV
jgi:hypothetical protein